MHMLIRYFDGRGARAILLATRGNTMRVAIPGCDDSTEFSLREGFWVSESNEPVEIQFVTAPAADEWGRFCDSLSDESSCWDTESNLFASHPAAGAAGTRQLPN